MKKIFHQITKMQILCKIIIGEKTNYKDVNHKDVNIV